MTHEAAAALERAIAAIDPDHVDGDARRDAEALAGELASHPTVGALAATMTRTLAACLAGEVEPHRAKWALASAALTLQQELARSGAVSAVALAGARHEMEILFPRRPESAVPPTAEELELLPPASLVRPRS